MMFDTIAAVSTPRGRGGIAVIRISGDEALAIADKVFWPKNGQKLSDMAANRAVYGDIIAPGEGGDEGIDDGIATVFRAPHSFTGEDTVEISCHGGIMLTQMVLEAVLAAGARAARAGEFTRRAFVAGRMGLSQAEALSAVLDAQSESQVRLSRGGLDGVLSRRVREIYEDMLSVASSVYANIDFPEEDLAALTADQMKAALEKIRAELSSLLATYRTGRAVSEGIRTVICGRTNVGKSSLYNLLVGRDAAIVTDIEGTTRDLLEETVSVGEVMLRLCDTAGLRRTEDRVEQIGVERARERMEDAELILAVFDASRPLSREDEALIAHLKALGTPCVAVLNKCDLTSAEVGAVRDAFEDVVALSAKSGDGYDALKTRIRDRYVDGEIDIRRDAVVANARQFASLIRAGERIEGALQALDHAVSEDLCCAELEEAMSALCEIDGRAVSEDVVNTIFSRFCVGK